MQFLTFMQLLETHLGTINVPLNTNARHLKELFETSPLHHDFMVQFAKFIYKQNRCTHLKADISKASTQQALSPLRLKALKSEHTDIDIYSFIDDLCFAIEAIFSDEDIQSQEASLNAAKDNRGADIIDFSQRRQRRLNSRA